MVNWDFYCEAELICPHCGGVIDDEWEYLIGSGPEGELFSLSRYYDLLVE